MEVKFNFFGFVLASICLVAVAGFGCMVGEEEGRKKGIEKTIELLDLLTPEEKADH